MNLANVALLPYPGVSDQDASGVARAKFISRASTATYIDNNGVLQTAGVNVPRYQNGALLVEGRATNNFPCSEDSTNPIWDPFHATFTVGPKVLGVQFFEITSNGLAPSLLQPFLQTVAAGYVGTLGVALLAGVGPNTCQVGIFGGSDGEGPNASTTCKVISGPGVVGSQVGATWTINNLSATVPTLVSVTRTFVVAEQLSLVFYVDAVSGHSLLIGRVQQTDGDKDTSYIPTTSAPATRAADIVQFV